MAYKILNNHVIIKPDQLPKKKGNRATRTNVEKEHLLEEKFSRLIGTEKTFFFSVPTLWNNVITATHATAPSIDAFKNHFSRMLKLKLILTTILLLLLRILITL